MNENGDIKSADPEQRGWAIMDISRRADKSALPVLLSIIEGETESNKRHVVRALGNIGGEQSINCLLSLLSSEQGLILGEIARALGKLNCIAALDRLEGLRNCETQWISECCKWAIDRIKTEAQQSAPLNPHSPSAQGADGR